MAKNTESICPIGYDIPWELKKGRGNSEQTLDPDFHLICPGSIYDCCPKELVNAAYGLDIVEKTVDCLGSC